MLNCSTSKFFAIAFASRRIIPIFFVFSRYLVSKFLDESLIIEIFLVLLEIEAGCIVVIVCLEVSTVSTHVQYT